MSSVCLKYEHIVNEQKKGRMDRKKQGTTSLSLCQSLVTPVLPTPSRTGVCLFAGHSLERILGTQLYHMPRSTPWFVPCVQFISVFPREGQWGRSWERNLYFSRERFWSLLRVGLRRKTERDLLYHPPMLHNSGYLKTQKFFFIEVSLITTYMSFWYDSKFL